MSPVQAACPALFVGAANIVADTAQPASLSILISTALFKRFSKSLKHVQNIVLCHFQRPIFFVISPSKLRQKCAMRLLFASRTLRSHAAHS